VVLARLVLVVTCSGVSSVAGAGAAVVGGGEPFAAQVADGGAVEDLVTDLVEEVVELHGVLVGVRVAHVGVVQAPGGSTSRGEARSGASRAAAAGRSSWVPRSVGSCPTLRARRC
jgi:hypothetical protein